MSMAPMSADPRSQHEIPTGKSVAVIWTSAQLDPHVEPPDPQHPPRTARAAKPRDTAAFRIDVGPRGPKGPRRQHDRGARLVSARGSEHPSGVADWDREARSTMAEQGV